MQQYSPGLTEQEHDAIAKKLNRLSNELSSILAQIDRGYGRESKAFRTGFAIDLAVGDLKEELAQSLAREWARMDGSMGVDTIVKARSLYEQR
jgi:hypothetical protein